MEDVKKGTLKAKKVTIGVLGIAVVMMAFAVVTLIPPVSAKTVEANQTITSEYGPMFIVNYDNITIWLDGTDSTVLAGQTIQFYNRTGGPSGKVILTGISGEAEDYTPPPTGSDGRLETTLKTGKYEVHEVRCDDPSYDCNVTILHTATD